jgi:hypothetical protein
VDTDRHVSDHAYGQEILAVVLLIPGCTATTRSSVSNQAPLTASFVASPARPRADVILGREIEAASVGNVYEAVARLRPEFFHNRGVQTVDTPNGSLPTVFVNDIEQRELETLRTIPAGVIVEIRYLSASAAAAQFGAHHTYGVIAVRTRH